MHSRKVLLVALALGATSVACGGSDSDDSGGDTSLGAEQALLVEDSNDVDESEESVETGIEEPASGAEPTDPGGSVDPSADLQTMAMAIKTNPGKYFTPAGCIVTTVLATATGATATHVFTNCTGPLGKHTYNGTITSTWTRDAANKTLTAVHTSSDFAIDGAKMTALTITVTHAKQADGTWLKTRKGDWSGATGKGKPITHHADYTATYDPASKCVTRDGSSSTTIGGREHTRAVTGYKRCQVGTGLGLCPKSGHVEITKKSGAITVKIDFDGTSQAKVTTTTGRTFSVPMLCKAN